MSPGPRVQHVGQLRDQHELAELRGRDGRDLPHPGGRARRPQLHLGRDRPGRRHRADPRADPPEREDPRQLLGGPDPRHPLPPRCPISIVGALVLVWQGVPQTWSPTAGRDDAPGRSADHRPRPDRLPGVDQGAGQQRRRVPQRELRPPVREPDRPHELARDVRHPRPPVRPDLHLRPVRRQPAPGLDDLRGDGAILLVGAVVRDAHRVRRQPALPGRRRPGRRRATWRARRPGSARPSAGCSWPSRPARAPGAINAWHDSVQPIAGLVPLFNMELGEVTPGGIGAGHVRDARHRRDPGGVHRRPDGRADARIPGQEGRGVRDQDGDARRPRAGRQHPRLHRARVGDCRKAWPAR